MVNKENKEEIAENYLRALGSRLYQLRLLPKPDEDSPNVRNNSDTGDVSPSRKKKKTKRKKWRRNIASESYNHPKIFELTVHLSEIEDKMDSKLPKIKKILSYNDDKNKKVRLSTIALPENTIINYTSDRSIKLTSDWDEEESDFKGYSDIIISGEEPSATDGVIKKRNSTKFNSKAAKMQLKQEKPLFSPTKKVSRKYTISQAPNVHSSTNEKYQMIREVRDRTIQKESWSYDVSEISPNSNIKGPSSLDLNMIIPEKEFDSFFKAFEQYSAVRKYTTDNPSVQNFSSGDPKTKKNLSKTKKSPRKYIFSFDQRDLSLKGNLSESTNSASPQTMKENEKTKLETKPFKLKPLPSHQMKKMIENLQDLEEEMSS